MLRLDPQDRYSMRAVYVFPELEPITVVERGRWRVDGGRLYLTNEPGDHTVTYQYRLADNGRRLVLLRDEVGEWSFERPDDQTLIGSWYTRLRLPEFDSSETLVLQRTGGYVIRTVYTIPSRDPFPRSEPLITVQYGTWRADGERLILTHTEIEEGETAYRYRLSEDGQSFTWQVEERSHLETVWQRVPEDDGRTTDDR